MLDLIGQNQELASTFRPVSGTAGASLRRRLFPLCRPLITTSRRYQPGRSGMPCDNRLQVQGLLYDNLEHQRLYGQILPLFCTLARERTPR